MFKWKREQKPAMDERIQKESNKLLSKLFYLLNAILLVVLVIKLVQGVHWGLMCLDILCLAVGSVWVIVQQTRKGIFLLREKDEVLTEVHQGVLAKGYLLQTSILLYGELVCMYLYRDDMGWCSLYFFTWIIPIWIYVVASIKNSWIQWGGKKRQTVGKKLSKKTCAIAGVLYGVLWAFMEYPEWLEDGVVSFKELIWIPIDMFAFAVLMYFILNFLVDMGEKRANKALQNMEDKERVEDVLE